MPEEVVKLKKHETVGTGGGHGQDCSEPQTASGCVCQIQPPSQDPPMPCYLRYSLILVLAQGPVNSDMLSPQSCPDTTTSDISSSQSCLTPSPQTPPLASYQPTPVISNRSSPQGPHDSLLHQTPPLSSSQPISCHLRQPSSQFLPHFRPSPLPGPAQLSVPSDTFFTRF